MGAASAPALCLLWERETEGSRQNRCGLPLAFHLNELQLDPIRPLEEAHSPATSYRGLLQNIDTTGLQFVHQRIQLVSINGNVLHTVMLCTFLAVDECGHIQCEPVQVQPIAIGASF